MYSRECRAYSFQTLYTNFTGNKTIIIVEQARSLSEFMYSILDMHCLLHKETLKKWRNCIIITSQIVIIIYR